jgi:hypothetical protein
MSDNTEGENSGAVRNYAQEALRKFRLKLLAIIDEKCPVQYSINGDEHTITVQFLEEKKRVKATAGGRGSRARRRKRREMQKLQYRQMQELENEMPDDTNENKMPDDTIDFSVVITEDGPDQHTRVLPVPTWATVLARYNDRPGGQHSSPDLHHCTSSCYTTFRRSGLELRLIGLMRRMDGIPARQTAFNILGLSLGFIAFLKDGQNRKKWQRKRKTAITMDYSINFVNGSNENLAIRTE